MATISKDKKDDAINEGKKSFIGFGAKGKLWSKECPWRHDTDEAVIFWRSYLNEMQRWVEESEEAGIML